MLALLLDPAEVEGRVRTWLPAEPQAAGGARRAVRALLLTAGLVPEDAELLVSELVGNAVRHASGADILLRASLDDGLLRVEVQDSSPRVPALPEPPDWASEGGRGLLLVERIADRWGAELVPGGKRLWFELRPDPAE